MSYAKISHEEAQAIVDDLKSQNVRAAEIRNRMIDEGFSFAEISEMIGEKPSPRKNKSLYGAPLSDNFSYQPPVKDRGFMFAYRAFRYGGVGIVCIFGFFAALAQGEIFPAIGLVLLSLFGFVRLWFLFQD